MAHSRSNLARLNECQSYFKPTSLFQVSRSWKRAPDSWLAHSLATSDPTGRCSGPLQVLGAGALLLVITVPWRSHIDKRLFPKKNSGCSLERLMDIGWPNIPFLVLENGRGATGRNVHRMDCHPRNRVHLQHMLQPHSWVWGPNWGQQFANAFVLWICESLIYGSEPNIIDIIWLTFNLKEINIVICVAGIFIASIWIFFNENFIFSLSSLSSQVFPWLYIIMGFLPLTGLWNWQERKYINKFGKDVLNVINVAECYEMIWHI